MLNLSTLGRIGIGIDLMTVGELRILLDRAPWVREYFFNRSELALCKHWVQDRKLEFLAGRFSAKESLQKALFFYLGARIRVRPSEIAILRATDRRPIVEWSPSGVNRSEIDIALSISHKRGVCVSAALIYQKGVGHTATRGEV